MKFPKIWRAETIPQKDRQYVKDVKRTQFNSTININLTMAIKHLAMRFGVPSYCILEHIIQIGAASIIEIVQDPKKEQVLGQHLISGHLLGFSENEDPKLLMLGQPNPFEPLENDMILLIKAFRTLDDLMFGKKSYPQGILTKLVIQARGNMWHAINNLEDNFTGLREKISKKIVDDGDKDASPSEENNTPDSENVDLGDN